MKLTKILIGVAAAALVCGCANQQVSDEATEGQKDGSCCASGQKEGKSCCSESAAGQCTEKKTEQKN